MNARSVAIARSVGVIGATGALIMGATFAAGTVGKVSLTGNTMSASAGLQIAPDVSGNPGTFVTSVAGFPFGSITPNGNGSPHSIFWMKNTTGAALSLSEAVTNVSGFANIDKTKVFIHVKATGGIDTADTLTHLNTTGVNMADTVPANGNATKFEVWTSLETGALNAANTSDSGAFDLEFTASN